MRIVSMLPSATEIICFLNMRSSLVGISHECNYPEGLAGIDVVTQSSIEKGLSSRAIDARVRQSLLDRRALYSLKHDLIAKLKPDLLVTQSLCNVCAVDHYEVEKVAASLSPSPQVINLEPSLLEDVFITITRIADATGQQIIGQKN